MKKSTAIAIFGSLLVAFGMRELVVVVLYTLDNNDVKRLVLIGLGCSLLIAFGIALIYKNVGRKS